MRLLQVSLRGLLIYSLILVLISIPLTLISFKTIINEQVDKSISLQTDQFLRHIKSFEYLDDLDTDLRVLDRLSYDIHIKPVDPHVPQQQYSTIMLYDSLEQEEKPFRQLSTHVIIQGKSYLLTVQMSLVDNDDLVMAIGTVQVVLSILLTAGLLLLNRYLSKRLWKPFYKTLDQLKAYELDKSESIVVEKSKITEFDDLNKTISYLTERNRKIFLDQKEFIENASHELQTPIAIFQSKLDVLMQSPNLNQQDAETILELESTAQRMARLNKNLLLLSKIDNEQFSLTEEVNLSSIIESQLNNLRPVAEIQGLTISTSLHPYSLQANKTLVEILLTNLFHNAIRYSLKGETIDIVLNNRKLSISNRGTPLSMPFSKITERFIKESSYPGSSGLGLAIVKKICDSSGYNFEYSFNNSTHTFSVTFQDMET